MSVLLWLWQGLRMLLTGGLILCVRLYRFLLRPLLPPACRFDPSCSEYMILAVKKYGPLWGVLHGLRRIGRCHPWSAGGHDPP